MKTPEGIPHYFYKQSTGGTNLHNHLIKQHPNKHNKASVKYEFLNRHQLWTEDASSQGIQNECQNLPPFFKMMFMNYLI